MNNDKKFIVTLHKVLFMFYIITFILFIIDQSLFNTIPIPSLQ